MGLLIFYLALALGVSFLCSVLEAVLLSVTPAYVAALADAGGPAGKRLQRLKADIDRPLAAILSLNTIAHTVGAAGAGAQAAHVFGDAWVGVASGVLTVLILVISEIIPKTLGAAHWRRLAPVVARVLPGLMWVVYPLVLLSQLLTRVLAPGHGRSDVSREEVSALASLGAKQGVFDAGEFKMLSGLFRLRSLCAEDIMTPRTVLCALPDTQTVAEFLAGSDAVLFSRLPVYARSLDDISGYVLRADVLLRAARDELDLPLSALRRPIKAVRSDISLPALLDELLESRTHLTLVLGPYGGTAGVVTLEDIVETLMGIEIVDEGDKVSDMRELARRHRDQRAAKLGLPEAEASASVLAAPAGASAPEPVTAESDGNAT